MTASGLAWTMAWTMADSTAFDRFEALFTDETAELLSTSDALSDRLVEIVELGLDTIEAMIVDGDDQLQIAALQKILPLATKVAEKRQDASTANMLEVMRQMMMEVFPDRESLSGPGIVDD